MNGSIAATALSLLRIGVGVPAWAAPEFAADLFGFDPPRRNRQGPYTSRLFGIRDIALAGGTLASKGQARKTWLIAGIVCDVADVAAAAIGRQDGHLSSQSALMAGGTAIGATLLGAIALATTEDDPVPPPLT